MTIQQKPIDVSESMAVADAAKKEAEALLALTDMFKVECAEDFNNANAELIAIKKKIREYETQRQELKAPILDAGRKVDAFFKPAIEILTKAEGVIKNQMIGWQREQERIRKEAEDLARKELEKAERARIKAIEKGDVEKVAKLEEKVAGIASAVSSAPAVPQAKGFYITEIWTANVVDLMALVKAVAAGKQPIELLLPNQGALDDMAKAHTTNLAVPGVLAIKKDSAGSRAR
jgi:uncharacterized coiled-coil DUF342 family protein